MNPIKVKVYKVSALMDEALKLSLETFETKDMDDKMRLQVQIARKLTEMPVGDDILFVKIYTQISQTLSPNNPNSAGINTTYHNSSSVFEFDEDKLEMKKLIVWSSDEEPLLDLMKIMKKSMDKNSSIIVEKTEQNTWSWKEKDMDYRFIFPTELEAYDDLLGYLTSVKSLIQHI